MNKELLNQIQNLEGVKVVELISDNQVLVIFTPEGDPEPVFISDDNIPVYPGDKYYAVSKMTLKTYRSTCLKSKELEERMLSKASYAKFINKNKAYEFIRITKKSQNK